MIRQTTSPQDALFTESPAFLSDMLHIREAQFTILYNASIQNNREIDRVHNYELYIATVSIKHKSVDRIKTALRFWLNATR